MLVDVVYWWQMEEEMQNPFDNYQFEVDKELEEVYVQAWDSLCPDDRFFAKIDLSLFLEMFGNISDELSRG